MGKKILIVDDDPVIRALVSDYLAAFGYDVITAESGKECLERLDSVSPDILFLDMQMPDMTGRDVLVSLKSAGREDVPVVLFSANDESRKNTSREGVAPAAFLRKPFDMKELLRLASSL